MRYLHFGNGKFHVKKSPRENQSSAQSQSRREKFFPRILLRLPTFRRLIWLLIMRRYSKLKQCYKSFDTCESCVRFEFELCVLTSLPSSLMQMLIGWNVNRVSFVHMWKFSMTASTRGYENLQTNSLCRCLDHKKKFKSLRWNENSVNSNFQIQYQRQWKVDDLKIPRGKWNDPNEINFLTSSIS